MLDILERLETELRCVSGAFPSASPPAISGKGSTTSGSEEHDPTFLTSVIDNPLGILASAAIERPSHRVTKWDHIFSIKTEENAGRDPVLTSLCSIEELQKLIVFYFQRLQPFLAFLDPDIHTVNFLRANSPFLTTVIVAISATFDRSMPKDQIQRLVAHAHFLAAVAFAEGQKSLEVIQAFLILVHWSPSAKNQVNERSWQYQGQAMRVACEIRLDLPAPESILAQYCTTMSDKQRESLLHLWSKTYYLVTVSEITLALQSGRLDTSSGHRLLKRPSETFSDMSSGAYIDLTHIFAKSLHFWHGLDKMQSNREEFISSWESSLESFSQQRAERTFSVDVNLRTTHIMLILLSLRLRSSGTTTRGLLHKCHDLAVQTMQVVEQWWRTPAYAEEQSLPYVTNSVIINIAYSAVLVLRLDDLLGANGRGVYNLVTRIATILENIGEQRIGVQSCASLFAIQVNQLAPARLHEPSSSSLNGQLTNKQTSTGHTDEYGASSDPPLTSDLAVNFGPLFPVLQQHGNDSVMAGLFGDFWTDWIHTDGELSWPTQM